MPRDTESQKAWQVTLWDVTTIVWAETRSKAKYKMIFLAMDAGYEVHQVWKTNACRALRAPEHDRLAKRRGR